MGYFKNQKFCCGEHSVSYQRQVQCIYKRFPFGKESDNELVRLQKLGQDYVLPLRQSDIELNERFSIWLENKERKEPLTATTEKVIA